MGSEHIAMHAEVDSAKSLYQLLSGVRQAKREQVAHISATQEGTRKSLAADPAIRQDCASP